MMIRALPQALDHDDIYHFASFAEVCCKSTGSAEAA